MRQVLDRTKGTGQVGRALDRYDGYWTGETGTRPDEGYWSGGAGTGQVRWVLDRWDGHWIGTTGTGQVRQVHWAGLVGRVLDRTKGTGQVGRALDR